MEEQLVGLKSEFIKLDQFLKWVNLVLSGSEAKFLIEAGKVLVNEEIELRRGRKIFPGDRVTVENHLFRVIHEIKGQLE